MENLTGRIVHYTDEQDPPAIHAAQITGINDDGSVACRLIYVQRGLAFVQKTDARAGSVEARGKWSHPV